MTIGLMERALALSPDSPAELARRGARDQRPCEPGGWLGDVLRGSDRNLAPGQTGLSDTVHGRAAVHLDPQSIGGIQSGYLPDVLDAPPRDSSVRGDPGRLADVQRLSLTGVTTTPGLVAGSKSLGTLPVNWIGAALAAGACSPSRISKATFHVYKWRGTMTSLLPRMVSSSRGCRPGHDAYVCRDDLARKSGDQRVASDRHAATWSR